MAAGKQGDKHAIHNIGLSNDDFQHFGLHARKISAKHINGALRIVGITHGRIIVEEIWILYDHVRAQSLAQLHFASTALTYNHVFHANNLARSRNSRMF